jgi:hypothetical protein
MAKGYNPRWSLTRVVLLPSFLQKNPETARMFTGNAIHGASVFINDDDYGLHHNLDVAGKTRLDRLLEEYPGVAATS